MSSNTEPEQYKYYFSSSRDGAIVCKILWEKNVLDRDFIGRVIQQLYACNMVSSKRTTLYTDFTTHILVTFCNPEKNLDIINKFIRWLTDLPIKELNENTYSNWFYTDNNGSQILNVRNFPPDIDEYLDNEKKVFTSIIEHSKYTTIIEIGCGAMVNLPVALQTKNIKRRYIGVDVDGKAINDAKDLISKRLDYKDNVTVICTSIRNLKKEEFKLEEWEIPILLFPFNLMGNIAPISLLICNMIQSELELIISIYDNTEAAVKMRSEYYSRCGYENVTIERDLTGSTIFHSQEQKFYTVSYDYMYIEGLISSFGYTVRHYDIHNGKVLHATLPK